MSRLVHVRLLLPQRRPAQRLRRVRRGPESPVVGGSPTPVWSAWSVAAAGPRRRTSPRRHRVDGPGAAQDPGRWWPCGWPGWSRSHHRRLAVRQRRRAHQHHRVGPVPQPDQGRGLRHPRCRSPCSRSRVGAQVIDINMDEGMIDGVAAMDQFTKADRVRARHQPRSR